MIFFDYTPAMTSNRTLRAVAFFSLMLASGILASPFLALPARANDAGTCYTISDADARALCLARAHRNIGMCYSIQEPSLRAQCRAEVAR